MVFSKTIETIFSKTLFKWLLIYVLGIFLKNMETYSKIKVVLI